MRLAARLAGPERDTINWDAPDVKWANSWGVSQVIEAARTNLIETLEREAGAVKAALNLGAIKDWQSSDEMTGCLTVLPHAAYHLGAVRQLIRAVLAPNG